jgi:hypothetical protein
MPLFEYVCMSSHTTDKLVRNRDDIPPYMACEYCGGPAFRKEFGYVNHTKGRTNTTESLSNYHEAALEAEAKGLPSRVWHAAKVRAEAQMLAGATKWDKDSPKWKSKEVT